MGDFHRIHWTLQPVNSQADAVAALEKLRQRALDIPFDDVSELGHANNLVGLRIDVAPGCEPLTIISTRQQKTWLGSGSSEIQGSAQLKNGGLPNFHRTYWTIWCLLDYGVAAGVLSIAYPEGDLLFLAEIEYETDMRERRKRRERD